MEKIKDNLCMITHTNKYVFHIVTMRGRAKSNKITIKPKQAILLGLTIQNHIDKGGMGKGAGKMDLHI